jgi:hypothetical protein
MLLELLRQKRGAEARTAAHAALEELDRATIHALPRTTTRTATPRRTTPRSNPGRKKR